MLQAQIREHEEKIRQSNYIPSYLRQQQNPINFSSGQALHITDPTIDKELDSQVTLVPLNDYKIQKTVNYDGKNLTVGNKVLNHIDNYEPGDVELRTDSRQVIPSRYNEFYDRETNYSRDSRGDGEPSLRTVFHIAEESVKRDQERDLLTPNTYDSHYYQSKGSDRRAVTHQEQ